MRNRALLPLAPLLLLAACNNTPKPNAATRSLAGQPSWLPIGSEVYQESDADLAAAQILPLRHESRWFTGFQHRGTREEYEKAHAHEKLPLKETSDGPFLIPSPPPYPTSATNLPTNVDGITLHLHLAPASQPHTILFDLTLHSDRLPLSREVEHRYTNILPFLFAFYIDGKAITIPTEGWGRMGGIASMKKLLDPGQSRRWQVQVQADSLARLLPDNKPHLLTAIAAFSNSQHEGYTPGDHMELREPLTPPPTEILLRSNPATLTWNGTNWQPAP